MKQWIGGLFATVIGGVLIYWLTTGISHTQKDPSTGGGTHSVTPPPPLRARMSELEIRTNLQGGDISNFDKPQLNTAGECSELCLRNDACKAMTFVEHPGGNGGVCWLKDTVPGRSVNPTMTSAVKITSR